MDGTRVMTAVEGWTRTRPWLADGALAAGLTALLLPTSTSAVVDGGSSPAARSVVIGALVLLHGVVTVRRVWPRAAFVVASASLLVMVAAPDLSAGTAVEYDGPVPVVLLPSAAVFAILLYSVAAWGPRTASVPALGVALVGGALTLVRVLASDSMQTPEAPAALWRLIVLVGVGGFATAPWALGRFRRIRADYVTSLEERAQLEEERRRLHAADMVREERARIAREMHDVVSHSLAVMVSQAEGGRMMAAKDPTVTLPVLETVATTGQEAMRSMRSMLDALDPVSTGEGQAPQPGLRDLPALVEEVRRSGVVVDERNTGVAVRLRGELELTAYRVVQEALTNVVKHAGACPRAVVALEWAPGRLTIRVTNPVESPHGSTPHGGRGISGMRERVQLAGGSLGTTRTTDSFEVEATLPTEGAGGS